MLIRLENQMFRSEDVLSVTQNNPETGLICVNLKYGPSVYLRRTPLHSVCNLIEKCELKRKFQTNLSTMDTSLLLK